MKREIKFRGKRIDEDRWIYGLYFQTPLTDENSGAPSTDGWFFLNGERRHCIVRDNVAFVIDINTLGQFTGLKDKNGVEIYEGDILKYGVYFDYGQSGQYEYYTKTVVYDSSKAAFHPCHTWTGYETPLDRVEVIGNIFENPELIEKI